MRRPPSPLLLPSYPVAGGVGLMATAVTVMTLTDKWSIEPFVMSPAGLRAQPWRLVTSALPHGDPLHLIFNVYWLWVFGTLLEEQLGHLRLLALVLFFAAGSQAAEYALFEGGIGLSGVGFGLVAMLWVLSTRDRRFVDAVDASTAKLFGVWFVFCIVATRFNFMRVANVAHAVGAILGLLVGVAMSAQIPGVRRILAGLGALALTGASVAFAGPMRRFVNLAHDDHGSFQLGYKALEERRFPAAVESYREAVATAPKDARAWHNLAIAYNGVGDNERAVDAARRSYSIDSSVEHRNLFVAMAFTAAQKSEDTAVVERLANEILAADPTERGALELLVLVYSDGAHEAELAKTREALARFPSGRSR